MKSRLFGLSATFVGSIFSAFFLPYTATSDLNRHSQRNSLLLDEPTTRSNKTVLDLMSLLRKKDGSMSKSDLLAASSQINPALLNNISPALINNTLARLLQLNQNGSLLSGLNVTELMASFQNRTGRGYGGGGGGGGWGWGGGGGTDPALLALLLKDDNHRGWGYPPWFGQQQQQSSGMDTGQLGLLTLLGLALIARMPTQG